MRLNTLDPTVIAAVTDDSIGLPLICGITDEMVPFEAETDDIIAAFRAIPICVTSLDLSGNHFYDIYSKSMPDVVKLTQAFAAIPTSITSLCLGSSMYMADAEEVAQVFAAIPTSVTNLDFEFSLYRGIHILAVIPASVTSLKFCASFDSPNAYKFPNLSRELAHSLSYIPASVTSLNLIKDFHSPEQVAESEIAKIFAAIPPSVTNLELNGNNYFSAFLAGLNEYELEAILSRINIVCLPDDMAHDFSVYTPVVKCTLISQVKKSVRAQDFTFANVRLPKEFQIEKKSKTIIHKLRQDGRPIASLTAALLLSAPYPVDSGLHETALDDRVAIDCYLDSLVDPAYLPVVQTMLALIYDSWKNASLNHRLNDEGCKLFSYLSKVCATVDARVVHADIPENFKRMTWDVSSFVTQGYFVPRYSAYISRSFERVNYVNDCAMFLQENGLGNGSFKAINTKYNRAGHTGLTLAASKHDFDMCLKLVDLAKADVNAVSRYGNTPLHVALYTYDKSANSRKVISWLFAAKARLDIKNKAQESVFDVARKMKRAYLIPRGIQPNS